MKAVGFLGFGTMGRPMARHLAAGGFEVRVYSRTTATDAAAAACGCRRAASPADAADGAEAVLSCVTDDDASAAVWLGPRGAISRLRPGAWAVELSTLSPTWIATWGAAVAAAGARAVDCPVTGSRRGAEAGSLTAFLGGPEPAPALAEILRTFCREIVPFGAFGDGAKFKLVYNLLGAAIGAALGEALALLAGLNLSETASRRVLETESWAAPAYASKGELLRRRTYTPASFTAALMAKDLRYLQAELTRRGLRPALAPLVSRLYQEAADAGFSSADFIAVREVVVPSRSGIAP